MKYLLLEQVDSTNSYVAVHADELEDMTFVAAAAQTAGRGQRGNSWESEPGMNLTFTLFHTPQGVQARDQFAISEAAALAVADTLRSYGIDALVKWPNDIYAGDRKIAGILIEHAVMGNAIHHSRIGIGLNVNQRIFRSDAPNPVSMAMLLGRDSDLTEVLTRLAEALRRRLDTASDPLLRTDLHREFLDTLWRRDGEPHPFRRRGDGRTFRATVEDVRPDGFLILRDEAGTAHSFAFKEVEFLLPPDLH